jgi:hypothetical protein
MKRPKMFTGYAINTLWLEISVLFVLSTIAIVYVFEVHWLMAIGLSPMIVGTLLLAVLLLVQVLWMVVVGADRVANAVGIRKSPLL